LAIVVFDGGLAVTCGGRAAAGAPTSRVVFVVLRWELDRDLRGNLFGGFTDVYGGVGRTLRVGADAHTASGTLHGRRRFDLTYRQFESASALRTLKRDYFGVGDTIAGGFLDSVFGLPGDADDTISFHVAFFLLVNASANESKWLRPWRHLSAAERIACNNGPFRFFRPGFS
jgi:hypothetical protein